MAYSVYLISPLLSLISPRDVFFFGDKYKTDPRRGCVSCVNSQPTVLFRDYRGLGKKPVHVDAKVISAPQD